MLYLSLADTTKERCYSVMSRTAPLILPKSYGNDYPCAAARLASSAVIESASAFSSSGDISETGLLVEGVEVEPSVLPPSAGCEPRSPFEILPEASVSLTV